MWEWTLVLTLAMFAPPVASWLDSTLRQRPAWTSSSLQASDTRRPIKPWRWWQLSKQATVSAIDVAEHSVVAIARVGRDRHPPHSSINLHVDPFRLGNPFPLQDTPDNPDFVPTLFGSGIVHQRGWLYRHLRTCAR